MTKKIVVAAAALAVAGWLLPAGEAVAGCTTPGHSQCETAVDQRYGGGGHTPTTVPIRACLSGRMHESIRLHDARTFFEVGFYYGKGPPEVVRTIQNQPCWSTSDKGRQQTGAPGAWVVAFIDCDYYTGWVGAKIPAQGGRLELRPVALPTQHDPCKNGSCGRGTAY